MSQKTEKDWKKFKKEQTTQEEPLENEYDADLEDEEVIDNVETPNMNVLDHPSYLELEEKLTLAEQKAHENWEKSVRALAELENVRRRAEREIGNAHRFGLEKFVVSLLPVIDSLEQALELADKEANAVMHEGLELTMKLFLDVLEKQDVRQLNPQGQAFDPQQHEAMSIQASADVVPNTVLAVFQKGYILNDRVIRPARVIVAKKP